MCLSGQIEQSALQELETVVSTQDGSIGYDLCFNYVNGFYVVEGELRTTLSLLCLRCLHEVALSLVCQVRLVVVEDESRLASVPENYEAWVLSDKPLTLESLLAEELLLAVPLDVRHQEEECVSG